MCCCHTCSFVPVFSLYRMDLCSAHYSYAEPLDLYDDPTFLGSVTRTGAARFDSVVAFVEGELVVGVPSAGSLYAHPESHLTPGVLEKLKTKNFDFKLGWRSGTPRKGYESKLLQEIYPLASGTGDFMANGNFNDEMSGSGFTNESTWSSSRPGVRALTSIIRRANALGKSFRERSSFNASPPSRRRSVAHSCTSSSAERMTSSGVVKSITSTLRSRSSRAHSWRRNVQLT